MARVISVTTSAARSDAVVADLRALQGLLHLQLLRGASIEPPGDVISVGVPNRRLNDLMRVLDRHGLGQPDGLSMSSSAPASYVPTEDHDRIERDSNEAAWEEMEMTIGDDTNRSANTLLTMFASGALAAAGIATNSLHVVIGGMLVAPGFMPIVRVALGRATGRRLWHFALSDLLSGYASLIAGAVLMTLVLLLLGHSPLPGSDSYYRTEQTLVSYWTTFTAPSLLASAAAALAGALLIASNRSVFTSGVMIGLALVPTAAITGMAAVMGEPTLAFDALLRFLADVAIVFVVALVALAVDQRFVHKRGMRL